MDTLVRTTPFSRAFSRCSLLTWIVQLDPYTTFFNVPVLSQNGERPIWYKGFHQTDVLRIKA